MMIILNYFLDGALSLHNVSTSPLKTLINFRDFSYGEFLDMHNVNDLIWREAYVPVYWIWKDSYFLLLM